MNEEKIQYLAGLLMLQAANKGEDPQLAMYYSNHVRHAIAAGDHDMISRLLNSEVQDEAIRIMNESALLGEDPQQNSYYMDRARQALRKKRAATNSTIAVNSPMYDNHNTALEVVIDERLVQDEAIRIMNESALRGEGPQQNSFYMDRARQALRKKRAATNSTIAVNSPMYDNHNTALEVIDERLVQDEAIRIMNESALRGEGPQQNLYYMDRARQALRKKRAATNSTIDVNICSVEP